jgi:uncharacterized protein YggE
MKRLLVLAFVTFLSFNALAQQVDLRKKISVSGTTDFEITPDIIYISISLKEYLKDNNSKKRVEITTLENELYNAILQAGLPKENLTVNSLSSYATMTEKKKNPEFLASKQYLLKVTDLNKYNAIIGSVDPKGIQSTNIASYDYSKMETLRKELKIKALQAAKAKAGYLVESVGQKLGSVLDIQEVNNEQFPQAMYRSNMMMMKADAVESAPEIDFKKIKLNYIINAVFEII